MCAVHSNSGDGHDNSLPPWTVILLLNDVLKIVFDKSDSEGKNGPVEIYVCGALIEMAVQNLLMKRQKSSILSASVKSASYTQ